MKPVQEPSYLVQFQRGEGQTSIFCFPFAGGFRREFQTFAGLAPLIGRRYSFYAVIARGTDGVSEPHRSVQEMAAAYIRQIRTVQPQGPYFMLGECFSAPVAYETAQQLRAQGEHVAVLAFLDARVPGNTLNRLLGDRLTARVRYQIANTRDSSMFISFRTLVAEVRAIRRTYGRKSLGHLLARMGKAMTTRTASLLQRKTESPGPPATIKSLGPVERAKSRRLDRAAMKYGLIVRRYQCLPYAGKINVIASTEWYESSPTMGWKTVGDLQIHQIPGKHETYLRENQEKVVRVIRDLIENAERETGRTRFTTRSALAQKIAPGP